MTGLLNPKSSEIDLFFVAYEHFSSLKRFLNDGAP